MARNRQTLTSGQWENLGSLIGDYLWDRESAQSLVRNYLEECGIPEDRMQVVADEVLQRVEAGFARPKKGE